ncbi:tandem-95 repeat protein [Photobacterium arenosum]|uniref:tandem-95 repeat protein n=1 Tax=Photobacterium arenosum TaxID=2774143 RepID=UPI00288B64C2|nr:tandem-95 repeat protein [Photobacterium arenosum]
MSHNLILSRLARATRQHFTRTDEVLPFSHSIDSVKREPARWVASLAIGLAVSPLIFMPAYAETDVSGKPSQIQASSGEISNPIPDEAKSEPQHSGEQNFDLDSFLAQTHHLKSGVQTAKRVVGELSPMPAGPRSRPDSRSGEAMTAAWECYYGYCYDGPISNGHSCSTDADCNGGPSNSAPTNISLTSTSINQSVTAFGTDVGTLSTTDADSGDTHSYSLVSQGNSASGSCTSDAANSQFQINSATLETGSALSAGNYNVCIQTYDGTTTFQKTFPVTVADDVAPPAPSTPDLSSGSDSGTSNSDNLTNLTTLTFTGTAEAGSTVKLFSNQSVGAEIGSATAIGGNWIITTSALASNVTHAFTATATDGINDSPASSALNVTIDQVAPTGQSVVFGQLFYTSADVAAASFTFASAEVGTDFAYTISSSGGGSNVTGSGSISNAAQSVTGLNLSGLSDGLLTLSATLSDSAGNTASAVTDTATLDTLQPGISGFTSSKNTLRSGETSLISVTLSEISSNFIGTDFVVSGGSLSNFTGVGLNYSAIFTPDPDTETTATLDLPAGIFTDAAGNANTAATQVSITVDTARPTVAISSDKPALKAGESATLTFTLSESSADFAAADVTTAGGTLSSFSGSGMVYTATYTPAVNATSGTINVSANQFTDAAGNGNTAATQLSIAVDTVQPTVNISSNKTALKQGETATLTFTLSESSSDFAAGDVIVSGGALTNFTGSGASYSATFTPDANSTAGATVNVAAGVFTDAAGNANTAASQLAISVDTVLPSVTINSDKSVLKQGETANITFTLTEESTDFEATDIAVSGGTLSGFNGSGSSFSATLTPVTDGNITLNIASGQFTDPNGNGNLAAIQLAVSYDGIAPYISALSPADDATDVSRNTSLTLTFSEDIQIGHSSGTLSLIDATDATTLVTYAMSDSEVSISGNQLVVDPSTTFTPTHAYYVTMTNDALTDMAGNAFAGISGDSVYNFTIANAAPVAADDVVSVSEDNLIAIDVLSNDSDADSSLNAASVTVVTAPLHGATSINTGTGTITYTPDANFAGTDTLTYQVQDIYGAVSSPATVTVTVTPVADAPVATADVGSTDEDTLVVLDVLANDSDVDTGDTLNAASLTVVTQPTHGATTVENGKIHYQPGANYVGTDTLSYTVQDSTGLVSNTAQVTVNVAGVNDAPITVADGLATNEDESGVIDVLANDSDIDGSLNASTLQVITQPQHGQTSIDANGRVTYTPNANYFGSDSFTYVVQDDLGATSQPATVSVTVSSVNDAPVVADDTATLLEDTPHTVNVLGNDQDIDGTIQAGTLTIDTQPGEGSVTVESNGAVVYTPAANFSGEDQFTYKVSDDLGAESNIATVTMTVQAVNDAPVANADQATTQEDTPVDIAVSGNDSDLDGTLDLSSIQVLTPPQLGQVLDLGNGSLRYTPDTDQSGTDSFSYTISDNEADVSNTATVSVTIETVNDAPTISGTPVLNVDQDQNYEFQPVAADVESDGLIFSITNLPDWASFDTQTGRLYGVPDNGAVGSVSNIVISVTDGDKTAALPPFTLTVNNVNDAPVISGQPQDQVSEDTQYSFTPQASDMDADTLTFSIENKPVWASFNTQTGELSGIPDNSHVGSSSGIVISVSDGSESASLAAFSISVINVNDAPQGENLTLTLAEDTSLSIAPDMTDVDSTALGLLVGNPPQHGNLSAQGSSWLYTPHADFNGVDSFSYQVTDGEALSGIYTVSLAVTPVNDQPVIVSDSYHFKASASGRYVLDVLSNDTDIDQDLLNLLWVTAVKGTATIQNGQAVLTTTQQGTFSLKYGASDGGGGQHIGQVTVVIESAVSQPPTIQPPVDIELNATGLFTRVNLGVAKAKDSQGRPLAVSLVDQAPVFKPGIHTVYWRAVDAQGNETQASQQVVLHPLITLSKDDHTTEGTTHSISVHLNGPAPDYPVTIPYTVSGSSDAGDHTLLDGVIEIEQGTSATIEFDVLNDGMPEGPETLEVTLSPTLNLGSKSDYTLTISEENLAPRVSTEITQDGDSRHIVSISGGQVTVSAQVTDVNSADNHNYLWEASDSAIANISTDDEHFIFVPGVLSQGVYSLKLTVTDNGTPVQSVIKHIYLEAVAQLPQLGGEDSDGDLLPDDLEGYIDSDNDGIPDYLDMAADCNVIQEQALVSGRYLLEGDPGVCLRKGATVAANQMGGVQLLDSEIPPDAEVKNTGGVFDFIAHGLPTVGQSYQVVLPQRLPIPANAVYRKFTESQGWKNFVTDAQNFVSSAQGEAGYCPPPGDSQWRAGLQEGHWCVQLTIQDGGPNDDDGLANGSVMDPGGVGVPLSANLSPSAVDDAVLLNRNGNTMIDVLANDTDANNDPLSVMAASVDFGVVNLTSNQIHYAAPDGFYGVATISYSISDGTGGTAIAQAKVTVLNSDYPVAVNDIVQTDDKTAVVIAVLDNDTDADGDSLTVVAAVANRGSVTINTDQSLTFTPEAGYEGESIITYHIQDATGLEASAQARVTTTLSEGMVVKNRAGGTVTALMLVLLGGLGVMRRWGGRLLVLVLALISFNSQAAWFVDAELGVSEASERHTQPADTLVSQDDSDTAVSLGVGYETRHHWLLTARYLDQGDGKATLKPVSAVSDGYHQSVVKATPVLTSGVALDIRYPVVSDNDFRFLIGGGVYRWEADYSSTFQGQTISSSDWGVDPYLTAGLDYRITPAWRVGGKFNRYFIDINDVSQVTLTLSYQFGQ